MEKMSGAKIFVETLKREGVEVMFGYNGAKVIKIYDELYDADIRHIMPHHEQGGIHAADGYARSTGKAGVVLTTSGPGATNLITGLATAYMDSVPVVAFTGQVSSEKIGTDSFQEADIKGISTPITKHNYLVQNVEELAPTIKEAFHIASSGRPGPVLVDMHVDILSAEAEFNYPGKGNCNLYKGIDKVNKKQVKKAAKLINEAEKAVIYAGGGVIISEASEEITKLAEKASIPVTTTLNAIGAFDEHSKLSLGMLGMHGSTEANLAVSNSDLLIAVGARFDDRVTGEVDRFAENAKIIHVDIDAAEIDKVVETDIPIVGDAGRVLKELLPLVEKKQNKRWIAEIDKWRSLDTRDIIKNGRKEVNKKLNPRQIIEELNNLVDDDTMITAGVGQHQMWAAQFYKYTTPRSYISSGGLGTMGYGFPAAIGVQAANPDSLVICMEGDGSFQMNIQELATAAKNDLPIKIIIFNNQFLGMVRQWQELFYDRRYSATCMRRQKGCPEDCDGPGEDCPEMIPDFVKVARGYGIDARRVTSIENVKPALLKALENEGPYLLDFIIEEEENVFPMVPPGASLDEMVLKKDLN